MNQLASMNNSTTSQAFTVCGDQIHCDEDSVYYALLRCDLYDGLYGTYDYIFVEDCVQHTTYIAKIHSIFCEVKTNSMCMEVQYFPIRAEGCRTAGTIVMEVLQTLHLRVIDLATVLIKPAKVMFLPGNQKPESVSEMIGAYNEHEEGMDTESMDSYDEKDSFIAPEGSVKSEDSEVSGFQVVFFYQVLALQKDELVPAVDPVLLDLIWSYNSTVQDTRGLAYQELSAYISRVYFNDLDQATLQAAAEQRYLKMREIMDNAIAEGDEALVDPYVFYMMLTS